MPTGLRMSHAKLQLCSANCTRMRRGTTGAQRREGYKDESRKKKIRKLRQECKEKATLETRCKKAGGGRQQDIMTGWDWFNEWLKRRNGERKGKVKGSE